MDGMEVLGMEVLGMEVFGMEVFGMEVFGMETFVQAVLQNGFSVAVAAFLLLRMERELRGLREAIERLRHCQTCRFSPMASDVEEGR